LTAAVARHPPAHLLLQLPLYSFSHVRQGDSRPLSIK